MTRKELWILKIKRNPEIIIGILILSIFLLIALFAPWIAPFLPNKRSGIPYMKPSLEHFLGTNDIGQDIFSEMVYGTRVSVPIGISAALCSTAVGTVLGIISGYLGGLTDKIISAVINVMMALPGLPLTLVMVAYFGGSIKNMIFIISLTSWVSTARIVRSKAQQLREESFVKIESVLGAGKIRIMILHLLPNIMDIILTKFALAVGSAMTTESSLSFLGLGNYGQKSWGNVLHYAFYNGGLLRGFYWWYLPPILCISLSMMSFMLITKRGQSREGILIQKRRKDDVRA